MPTEDDPSLDPADDDFWSRYLESRRLSGVEPVSRQRARELVREWAAEFERGGNSLH